MNTEQNDLSFVDPDGFKKADETLKYGEVPTEQKGWRDNRITHRLVVIKD